VAPGGVAPVTATVPVVFIDSQVTAGSATVTLRADVQNSDLAYWPGQTINVTVEAGQTAPLVLVPNVAVMPQQNGALVYVAGADGTAEARKVTVALREGDLAGISTGLKPGEKVVTEGQGQLHGGAKLKIMPAEGTAAPADKATAGTAEGTAAGGAIKS
ncbi:efflux RND transporter periplasmic adaptor subunit, partial [Thioclava sp. BHET1]